MQRNKTEPSNTVPTPHGKLVTDEYQEDETLKLLPVPKENDINSQREELVKEQVSIDPLSEPTRTPNRSKFSVTSDSLDIIKVDVPRLLLSPLFTSQSIQDDIVQILYNYDHSYTSYRQGYHELCGLIYLVLHEDSDDETSSLISRSDFNKEVFTTMINFIGPIVSQFYIEDSILGWSVSIFNRNLLLVDYPLYELLLKYHHIETQIWVIRWVRLILLRELGLQNSTRFVDFMWSYDSDITKLMSYIIIILLIRIKLSLVECEDSGEVLYLLLHYPYIEYSDSDICQMIEFAIQMDQCHGDEKKLKEVGVQCNKWFHKGFKWEKVKDLGKLRLELKLKRRVRGVLGGSK
ncbi:hypothetical protein WICPIJ_007721 [Wickerhamomyces pijperi]|uniref:Rab-GAP TBC domain-containing protein n=1 Tax=Wickerhamomyces pijperi TaxID=599730 RepID=A0A9P8TJP1_WICPI|nr:hypothetical protein WICPIJ_007721 [Wickerhamomyces pijperi]